MSVWFQSCLNPWYIWIPSNPNMYSTKIIMKMRWQTIASIVSIRTISPTATPLPKTYDCVAVYIAGRRTSLVVYGWWPQPPTKKQVFPCSHSGSCTFVLSHTHIALQSNWVSNSYLVCKFRMIIKGIQCCQDVRMYYILGRYVICPWNIVLCMIGVMTEKEYLFLNLLLSAYNAVDFCLLSFR